MPHISCLLLILAIALEDSSLVAQIHLAASYLKHTGTEFLFVFCPHVLSVGVYLGPGNVRGLMCLRSISTNRGWESVDEFPRPLSFRWTVLRGTLYSFLELPGNGTPLANNWSPSYAPLFGLFLLAYLTFLGSFLPSVTWDCLQKKLPTPTLSQALLSGEPKQGSQATQPWKVGPNNLGSYWNLSVILWVKR